MAHDLVKLLEELDDSIDEARALCVPVAAGARLDGGEGAPAAGLVKLFRARGIARLLARADRAGFRADLVNAARTRRYLLEVLERTGVTCPDGAASRLHGLVDALAAGDVGEARGILERTPLEFRSGHEYEEDFLFAATLRALVQEEDAEPFLERWAVLAEDVPDARLDVVRALQAGDAGAFDVAFVALLDHRSARIAEEVERVVLETPMVLTDRRVYVEGLALLALAGGRGLATRPEYSGCPALARGLEGASVPPEAAPVA